jgi:hypothetical protein
MTWEPMTIDEYADFQRAGGANVIKIRDTWWTEARPFFFRPLFPFTEITPKLQSYPLQSMVGGVMHLVPAGVANNSYMHLFLYDELEKYSINSLGAKQRWIIKKGMDNFSARRMLDPQQFIEEAYAIYESFYKRTRYFYKSDRTNRENFATWARPLFENPKVVVLGAYHRDKLCAIDISYQVDDVIIDDVFFSDTESQSLRVTDFLLHTLRESAKSTSARLIFRGFPSGKRTLDESKVSRGCKVLKLPAYFKINPLALLLGRTFMDGSYKKLMAITSFTENKEEKPQLIAT